MGSALKRRFKQGRENLRRGYEKVRLYPHNNIGPKPIDGKVGINNISVKPNRGTTTTKIKRPPYVLVDGIKYERPQSLLELGFSDLGIKGGLLVLIPYGIGAGVFYNISGVTRDLGESFDSYWRSSTSVIDFLSDSYQTRFTSDDREHLSKLEELIQNGDLTESETQTVKDYMVNHSAYKSVSGSWSKATATIDQELEKASSRAKDVVDKVPGYEDVTYLDAIRSWVREQVHEKRGIKTEELNYDENSQQMLTARKDTYLAIEKNDQGVKSNLNADSYNKRNAIEFMDQFNNGWDTIVKEDQMIGDELGKVDKSDLQTLVGKVNDMAPRQFPQMGMGELLPVLLASYIFLKSRKAGRYIGQRARSVGL